MASPHKSELRLLMEAEFAQGKGAAEVWKKYKDQHNFANDFNFYKYVSRIRNQWLKSNIDGKIVRKKAELS